MRVFSIKKESIIFFICAGIILTSIFNSIWSEQAELVFSMPLTKKIILIDAGHGGWDPGKVAHNNILEKNINLTIAKKLQEYLEQSGAFVLMTRTQDQALDNRKGKDMCARKKLAHESKADIFISIHQNSFKYEKIHGAQVFYYKDSLEAKRLAELIQEQIKIIADQNNKRVVKTNSDYFILKHIKIPSVIIECGFLSNQNELANLSSSDYQNKIAWSIYLGILNYFAK